MRSRWGGKIVGGYGRYLCFCLCIERIGSCRYVSAPMSWRKEWAGSVWGRSGLPNTTFFTILPQIARQILMRQLEVFRRSFQSSWPCLEHLARAMEVRLVFINARWITIFTQSNQLIRLHRQAWYVDFYLRSPMLRQSLVDIIRLLRLDIVAVGLVPLFNTLYFFPFSNTLVKMFGKVGMWVLSSKELDNDIMFVNS